MEILVIAVILGLVEGVTEFIPVSSTGHLIIAGHLLGFTGEKADTFEIFIQMGAILAVVGLEWRRLAGLLRPAPVQGGFAGGRGLGLLALTTLPVLLVGFFLGHVIKSHLFRPGPVAWALLVGGIGILLAERYLPPPRTTGIDALTWKQALIIGLFQCLAVLWPGMSRSASTIIGGLFSSLDRKTAAAYSFLAAIPALTAAVGYDLLKSWRLLERADLLPFAAGFVVAFLAAWATIRVFIALLGRSTLRPFAWYRVLVAPVILLLVR